MKIELGIALMRGILLFGDRKNAKGSDKSTGCVQSDLPFNRQIDE